MLTGSVPIVLAGALVGRGAAREAALVRGCELEGSLIEESWNDAIEARVRASLLATNTPPSQFAANNVDGWLGRAANAWRTTRTETCTRGQVERTWDEGTLERARWCLDDRMFALRALVERLQHADATTSTTAIQAAVALPAPGPCLHEGYLSRLPMTSAADRDRIQSLRAELGAVDAMQVEHWLRDQDR